MGGAVIDKDLDDVLDLCWSHKAQSEPVACSSHSTVALTACALPPCSI